MKDQQNKNRAESEQIKSPTRKEGSNKKQKIECRKIPETLVEPYDLVTLKQQKKKRFQYKKAEIQQEAIENAEIKKLRPLFGECQCSEDIKEQYIETVYQLTSTLVVLSKICSFRIRDIKKIKLIGESYNEEQVKPVVIKITWGGNQEQDENIYVKLKTVQESYFLFASIISRKLLLEDFVLIDISKKENKTFQKSIKAVEGQIYKVSTFLRKWERRNLQLDDKLKIMKQDKVVQQIKNIKQLWTRFSMHNGYFVVKMFQGIEKIELGIPLGDYSNIESERNWLFLLAKLIK